MDFDEYEEYGHIGEGGYDEAYDDSFSEDFEGFFDESMFCRNIDSEEKGV